MSDDGDIQYEAKTIKTVRGLEARSVERWKRERWELTGQTQGLVRSGLTFRRAKTKTPKWVDRFNPMMRSPSNGPLFRGRRLPRAVSSESWRR